MIKVISTQFLTSLLPSDSTFKPTENITKYNKKLLISAESGIPHNTSEGLFELDIKTNSIKHLFKGNFAGIKKYNNHYYVLNRDYNQLWILDNQLNQISQLPLDQFSNIDDLHGIDISSDGYIYIVGTNRNKVLIINQITMQKEGELILTNEKEDFHHINDICVTEDSLYLSMFSILDKWKTFDFSDGAIVKFDRRSLLPKAVVCHGLKAPHSVLISEDNLLFCDSLNLNVSKVNLKSNNIFVVAQFHGFTRGLFLDNDILIVGQSNMRHLQQLNNKFNNISLNAGIHIFDLKSNINQYIKLPVTNVYSVIPF
ncbi:DUF4915 domain-containing protein [Peribacillus frigoritolerans]|uniref:DUF4915 domain-containing protein n=1 Tax=Peribacillus frigoritolerans TaxID=450367 RepID=UPI003B8ABEE4